MLKLAPNYSIGLETKQYNFELIIDTENAIRYLGTKIQRTYGYLATKQFKNIMMNNKHNTLHNKYQFNRNKFKKCTII